MKTLLLFLCMFLCASCASQNNSYRYDAIVSKSSQFSVASKTTPHFETIQAALSAAPNASIKPFRIYVDKGVYREKLVIEKSNVQLIGKGSQSVRIVFNDYAGKQIAPNKILTTFGTATIAIKASDIRLENITIENDFDFRYNDALANDDPSRISGLQAVALHIDTPSDRVIVRNVSLLGNQDTLFINSGRSWFDRVLVVGNIDFIFGKGNGLFTASEIKTIARGKASSPHGFITAPSTNIHSLYGFTFLNCRLTRVASVPDNSVALGRPWHPTTDFPDGRYADPAAIGKSVFINTWMDGHIMEAGWYSMTGTAKEGGKKTFLPEDSRFFEYKSFGRGALINDKRKNLSANELPLYAEKKIVGDWQPQP